MTRKLTPPQIARSYGVKHAKVMGWIRSGELPAVNVASNRNGQPRYVVDRADLAAFEAKRLAVPTAKTVRRSRRRENIIQFV